MQVFGYSLRWFVYLVQRGKIYELHCSLQGAQESVGSPSNPYNYRQCATDKTCMKTTHAMNEMIKPLTWLLIPDLATSIMPEVIEHVL